MCSKRASLSVGRWSITTRLTVWFSLAAALIQALLAIYLYTSLQHTYIKGDRQFLLREIQLLQRIVAASPLDLAHLQDEQREGLDLPSGKYYSRILDAQQRLLSETPGMPAIATLQGAREATMPSERWLQLADGRSFFVLVRGSQTGAAVTFQMAIDVSSQAHRLIEYRRTLMIGFVLGLLLSALAAFLVARQGLKPLANMAGQLGDITATRLMQHLSVAEYPQELAELVLAFNHMLARLNQSFEQLQQFSADIAHELRTPVNNLIGESEVALSQVRSLEDYQQLIASNLDEYHRLTHIIEALLFLARADNTEITAKKQPLDAAEQVQGVFSYFEALAEEKGMTLACTGQGTVQADMQLLRRVLSNLIHNSLKYSHAGATVTVAITSLPHATLIRIHDQGVGIGAQHLPRIFDRFYRASASRSESGTGLGLAIVKSIMAVHGGNVSLESQPGVGTCVILQFNDATA